MSEDDYKFNRERKFQEKQEGNTKENKLSKEASSSTSRQWSLAGSRNPRIVRVSRSFGGKDRHSKVCTVSGLRDRRIRLSVPTAIQLYDLQDRLGLGQPSKVVDWLLDVTQEDIDKLPPLQGNFGQYLQSHDQSNVSSSQFFDGNNNISFFNNSGIKINDGEDQIMMDSRPKQSWDFGDLGLKNKEIVVEEDKNKWITKINEEHENQNLDHGINIGSYNSQVSAQNFFPISNETSIIPDYNINSMGSYNPYYQYDPSQLSLSQFGGSHVFSAPPDQDPHNSNVHSSVLPSGSSLFFCPPTIQMPTFFPTNSPYFTSHLESDPRQINPFQFGASSSHHFQQQEKDKNGS